MKKRFLTAMLLMGLFTGSTAAFAEALEGVITFIDAEKDQIQIVPTSSGVSGKNISVSVSEFIKANGLADLNDLDVGKTISMTIRKDPGGRWVMTSLKKPEVLIPDAEEKGTFLKTKGRPKKTNPLRSVFKKLS